MKKGTANTFEYGIIFLTSARETPQVHRFADENQRNECFEEVVRTAKIKHGLTEVDIIATIKCQMDGEMFYNHELMQNQRKHDQVTT